jgi:putative ABC transport system permease protein
MESKYRTRNYIPIEPRRRRVAINSIPLNTFEAGFLQGWFVYQRKCQIGCADEGILCDREQKTFETRSLCLTLAEKLITLPATNAVLAAGLGALVAWRSAPLVVTMIQSSDSPVRLLFDTDWRVLGFGVVLVFCVLLLFGVLPALRASAVKPVSALKGGEDDPHSRRQLMHGMIAAQVAFCFLVIFMSGLFVRTFESLSDKPLGFSPENLLLLDVVTQRGQPAVVWDQVADNLRNVRGVERVAIAGWPLLSGGAWNNFVSIGGAAPSSTVTYLLAISPGWSQTMKIPLLEGRDFRTGDTAPGEAIVNQTFVKTFFDGKNPIGRAFQERDNHYRVVGLVADAPYRNLRDAIVPVAYIPS